MKTYKLLERIDWANFERVVILSPHLDDAALSCGGLLHALRDRVSTLVVSICCGSLRQATADGSSRLSSRRGHASSHIRRIEDIAAMHSVDTDFVHLGFADGIYRRSPLTGRLIYRSSRERWTAPHIEDLAHIEELYLVLRRLCLDLGHILLISPMGIGHHVDHQITARVAMRMAASNAGAELLFYEDFPYVADPDMGGGGGDDPLQALIRLRLESARRLQLPVEVDAKMAVLEHYASQVPALFGDAERMRARIAGHCYEGTPAEIYWRPPPAARNKPREIAHVE
jgi:LmbE family N-acetylglucosaminyl deacetylase